ncbi:bifunctional pyr operon transcriptional regulator/uracil phosphoribosyltransferase PyrR [bacterium]|nr:bifunctional pyr operon transcriptional regulator/uracil phosphoribosyltransferase PyrR [bacterium]
MKLKAELMDSMAVSRTLMRVTHEICERNKGVENLAIIGIRNRGDILARRINENIKRIEKVSIPIGILDITLYRDDFRLFSERPVVQETDIDFDLTNKRVILVDDVLFTGRTVRSALDAVIDLGRPSMIQLAVLIDRGHRELPIKPDYVGKNVPTSNDEQIQVKLKEVDGEDLVLLIEP